MGINDNTVKDSNPANAVSEHGSTIFEYAFRRWPRTAVQSGSPALIGLIDGEGIGPEIMRVCRLILEEVGAATAQQFHLELGGIIGLPAFAASGEYLSKEIVDFCQGIGDRGGAVLCGPGGGRFVYDLRRRLDLFCKLTPLRPLQTLSGLPPLQASARVDVDILVVRENLGGLYQGSGHVSVNQGQRRVRHSFEYEAGHVEQILRVGARLAERRRGHLCAVYKPGGVPEISALWQQVAELVAAEFDIELTLLEIDNACYQIVAAARDFDVIVAPNMFGDVIADGAAVLLGSRGMSYSANFSETGVGIYQTGHGAAKDIAGSDRANPIGQIHSMVFMLREHFGLQYIAQAIEQGVEDVLASGWRTFDIMAPGGRLVGTQKMGELIAEAACARLRL